MILICGMIGSGKSVVSRILRLNGHDVFDCDYEAKRIMDSTPQIKTLIRESICRDAVSDCGVIDRRKLSDAVFSDQSLRMLLNREVHALVRNAVLAREKSADRKGPLFVESAIPVVSGLASMASQVWVVTAPLEVRRNRVLLRSGLDSDRFNERCMAQEREYAALPQVAPEIRYIFNDGSCSLLQVVDTLAVS